MSKFIHIANLIRFTKNEAEKLMKGSVHEDNLYIVHDALGVNDGEVNNKSDETKRGYSHRRSLPLN